MKSRTFLKDMRTGFTAILLTTIVSASAVPARAQARTELVPSVSFSTAFDDNIFTTQEGGGDTMMLVTPAFEGLYESPKTLLSGVYAWDMQRAVGFSTLNSLDAKRHGVIDAGFQLTPQFRLSLIGRYDVSNRPGDLVFDTGVLLGRQRARRYQVTPAIAVRVQTRTTITAQYDATTEALGGNRRDELGDVRGGLGDMRSELGDMRDELGDMPELGDIPSGLGDVRGELGDMHGELYIARLGVSRVHSTRDTWSVSYLGRTFANAADMFNPATSERSHALMFVYDRALAVGSNLGVQVGPRVSSYGNDKPEVLANFSKVVRAGKFGLDFWQGETIILGIRGPVDVTSFSFKSAWLLRRSFELGAYAGVFNSVTLHQGRARVLHPELVLSYNPRGPYIFAASYGIDFQKGDVRSQFLSDKEVVRHLVLLRVTFAPRLSRIRPADPNDPRSKGVSRR